MVRPNSPELEKRVYRAAEAALARQQYVSAIDVLWGSGYWRLFASMIGGKGG
jgi:hypothetical protein